MELTFGMPLVFKDSLATGDRGERNAYTAWNDRFSGKTVYLIGWCDGGCNGGTHRWSEQAITEEVVVEAERNTRRLRTWWENVKYKRARHGL